MEFTKVGYLHMLLYVALELINLIQGHGSNSAIVNVNNDNNELTRLATPEVDGLINGTLGESQLVNEDLHQSLIPATPALLQTIQRLSKMADFVGVIDGFEARGLPHVYDFVIGERSIEICALDVDLMKL